MTNNPFTVSVQWLRDHLDDPDISIVDASWYLPTMLANGLPRNGKAEFEVQHIPGARFFDIDDITEPESTLPHTLASPAVFSKKIGELGISNEDTIVVYDGYGLFSAPRAWWNFRVMGATKVVVLDGGFPAWLEARMPVESGTAPIKPATFNARFDQNSVVDFKTMQDIVASKTMPSASQVGPLVKAPLKVPSPPSEYAVVPVPAFWLLRRGQQTMFDHRPSSLTPLTKALKAATSVAPLAAAKAVASAS